MRPETLKILNDEENSCYGEKITFEKLKLTNVSTNDLFKWNAIIEIIDLYEKYLLLPNLINDNEIYCKCFSLSQFGKYCQYKFNYINVNDDNEENFNNLLIYTKMEYPTNEEIRIEYVTCYIGIQCKNNLLCLDWRQICDGIVDCDQGEDEPFELCLQMEQNQCNTETEFRCKNGLCIPMYFVPIIGGMCLDRSDDLKIFNIMTVSRIECISFGDFHCNEYSCPRKEYSCGDGQCISYLDAMSGVNDDGKTCHNKRNIMYLKKLFSSNNENQCWISMICLTGFNRLYSNIVCSNNTIENNIDQYCPDEYYFPPNSVVYSFVYFLYEKINRTDWFKYTGPNYICYNKQLCDKHISILPTILKNNLTCFYVNQIIFSWLNFYEYIIYLFNSCFYNFQNSLLIENKRLYKCNSSNTFISIYRLKDKRNDCFFNEDENSNINLCSFNLHDQFQCLINKNECIPLSSVSDSQYDCSDGSDEYSYNKIMRTRRDISKYLPKRKMGHARYYQFRDLCDKRVNPYAISDESNETDEIDCEYWSHKCDSYYSYCDGIWNCENGRDEMFNCPISSINSYIKRKFRCDTYEHYCIQLINNNNDINLTCINIHKSGDGIIDCIGGTDERLTYICNKNYLTDLRRRFYCMNSSICIRPEQVCDRIIDCPFEDDERVCPWLFKSNSSKFYCKNFPLELINRCSRKSSNEFCQLGENLWFCDLDLLQQGKTTTDDNPISLYPNTNKKIQSFSSENINTNKLLLVEKRILSRINTNINMWLCNHGYPVQSIISFNKSYCLCPPSYYGDNCQYQSELLTIILKIQNSYDFNPLTVYRLIIYLLNENNIIISYDEIIYNNKLEVDKIFVYLLYERIINISLYERMKSKFVRIDSYIIKETNIQYISSWFFHISYPFLPVNRLHARLTLENELFKVLNCKKQCGKHGKCMYYVNAKHIEYCWCKEGWFGDICHLKSLLNLCNKTSCAPHSQCVILNNEKKQIKCICPLGKSGNQCYIKYNPCLNVLCKNNGTCLPLDQRNFGYVCICMDNYIGTNCQYREKIRYISIPANISSSTRIRAIIVILSEVLENILTQQRFLYENVLLPTTLQFSKPFKYGLIQIFHNLSINYYYMFAIQSIKITSLNSSVIHSNLCQNVSKLFNETILYRYSYLKRLKLYHLPCYNNQYLRCFFDEYRMCFCTKDHSSHCYLFNHDYSNCNECINNGLCLKQDSSEEKWGFICICSECSYGTICQFLTGNYFITLDMLIGIEIKTNNVLFSEQPFIIHLTLIILIIILIFSFISNIISLIILSNKKLRQVGCDLYLLALIIISQIGVILLFLRFLYMIIIQIYIIENILFIKISCIFLEYLTRLIPSLFDWLTVCISIERAYTVIKDVHFTKIIALKTLKISRWIIIIILLFNILTTLHRPFYLTIVDEPALNGYKNGHPWCILNLNLISWNIYEKFINIFHLIIPLILNLLSIISFLFYKTKFQLTTTVRISKNTNFIVIKKQISKYKPLLISTIILIILKIPSFVLTFVLTCIRYQWQRYVYLTGYFISFLPLTGILFIYILPSPKYKESFRTIIQKRFNTRFITVMRRS